MHLLKTVVAYFGLPLVALGLLGPLLTHQYTDRVTIFFALVSVIPILALLVIVYRRMIVATWYYGFVALIGFAALTSMSLDSLFRGGYRRTASVLGSAAVLYYLVFLGAYHTSMHGDRPRWKEAVDYLKQEEGISISDDPRPHIFATVPGVVGYYLGVNPGETMGHPSVQKPPQMPPTAEPDVDHWYVVKASHISEQYAGWFNRQCQLKARFPARTGPVDRSTLVYHCRASSTNAKS
jgi:hypothetical protein